MGQIGIFKTWLYGWGVVKFVLELYVLRQSSLFGLLEYDFHLAMGDFFASQQIDRPTGHTYIYVQL